MHFLAMVALVALRSFAGVLLQNYKVVLVLLQSLMKFGDRYRLNHQYFSAQSASQFLEKYLSLPVENFEDNHQLFQD